MIGDGLMKRATLVLAVLALLLGCVGQAEADVLVDPMNLNGWVPVIRDANGDLGNNPTGVVAFVTGPATPPLGIGSLNLQTGNGTTHMGGDGSAQIDTSNFDGTLLSTLSALSYSTYVTSNNGQQFPYLKLNVALNDGSGNYDQLFFEPPYQTPGSGNSGLPDQGLPALNTWQTWNALEGGWWDNGWTDSSNVYHNVLGTGGLDLVAPLSTFLALYPNATIQALPDGYGTGVPAPGVSLRVGFASAGDVFNGYVDNFTIATTIGQTTQTTTYDFDPAPVVPEPAALTLWGIGIAVLAGFGWRRLRQPVLA